MAIDIKMERVNCEHCDVKIDTGLLHLQADGFCDICDNDIEYQDWLYEEADEDDSFGDDFY